MKIAYVVSMKNGLHSFIYREIVELEKMGFQIIIFPTKLGSGPYMPPSRWPVFPYKFLSIARAQLRFILKHPRSQLNLLSDALWNHALIDFLIASCFTQVMEREKVDWIHCHFGDHKLFIGYFCKELLGYPLSATIHAYELYNNPNPQMFKKALEKCDRVVTISEYNKRILTERYQVPEDSIKVIRLFTRKGLDEEIRFPKKELYSVLIVSRFVEKKGHETLFEAFRKLNRSDVELWVVGNGPIDLRNLAKKKGIVSKVKFFGTLSDEELQNLYRGCDIFCLPSKTSSYGDREGIPVALMEAMAFGKPVISTNHAGIPELVDEILVEENDSNALANEIERLLDNRSLRIELGRKNREKIRKEYSSKNVQELAKIFRGET